MSTQINTKAHTVNYLGMPLTVQVPATLADYCTSAGVSEDEALGQLNSYYIARAPASLFRKTFLERAEEVTGIKRETKQVGSGDDAKTVFAETEAEYFERVVGDDTEHTRESLQPLADEVASSLNWLPTPGTGRIGKEWTTNAENMLQTVGDDAEKMSKVIANLGAKGVVVNVGESGFPSVNELAAALKAYNVIKEKENQAELLG